MRAILQVLLPFLLVDPPMGRLSVTVLGAGQEVRAERYCAVLSPGSPEPVREVVLPADAAGWTLELKPGRYGLVCSAFGFSAKGPMSLEILPGETTEIRVDLKALVSLQGKVIDQASGKPVAGATIELLSQKLGQFPLQSALLTQHLRKKHLAVTNEAGSFRLPVVPQSETTLAIAGPGLAHWVVREVKVGPEGGNLGELQIPPGGDLEVRVRGAKPWQGKGVWLRPVLKEADLGVEVTDELITSLEKLTSVQVHQEEVVRLSGLVAGTYRLFLWDSSPGMWTFPSGATPGPFWVSEEVQVTPGGLGSYEFNIPEVEAVVELSGGNAASGDELTVRVSGPDYYIQSHPMTRLTLPKGNKDTEDIRFSRLLHHPGRYTFWLSETGFTGGRFLGEIVVRSGERGIRRVRASLSGGAIALRVVGAKGLPVKGAKVWVKEKGASCRLHSAYWCTATTGEDGLAECKFAPEQELVFWVWHEKEGWARFETFPAKELVANLRPGRRIEVWVVGEDSEPLQDFVPFFAPMDDDLLIQFASGTDQEGHVILESVPDTDGVLAFASFAASESTRPVAFLGLEKGQSGVLSPVRISRESGRVRFRFGSSNAPGSSSVRATELPLLYLEKDDLRLPGSLHILFGHSVAQRQAVEKSWRRLPEGRYRVVAADETCAVVSRSKPFVVRAGEETKLSEKVFSP
ncbi:MAG: carboxypeptidase-like regulatory domain-containing protein [Thermoanaerobaculum sp.]